MNTDQFCERLCSTYRLPRNKGNDYLHIHVNPSSTPFVLLHRLSAKSSNPNDRAAYRLDVSVSTFYFDLKPEWVGHIIREWYPLIITHIEDLGNHLYKAIYIKQGRGYQLNLASTYVFYDGYRIASDDNLEKLKLRTVPIIKVPTGYFDNTLGETLIEEFGDYLITETTAFCAGFCSQGVKDFIDVYELHNSPYITLKELTPMLLDYDCEGWYNLRKLAAIAWRQAKNCK